MNYLQLSRDDASQKGADRSLIDLYNDLPTL